MHLATAAVKHCSYSCERSEGGSNRNAFMKTTIHCTSNNAVQTENTPCHVIWVIHNLYICGTLL